MAHGHELVRALESIVLGAARPGCLTCFVAYNGDRLTCSGNSNLSPSQPNSNAWLRWAVWLLVALAVAISAEIWRAFNHSAWLSLAWLLPFPILIFILLGSLWRLLGSRRTLTQVDRHRAANRRKVPRNPKVHLQELQRSREYWAVVLRLPPEGACESAKARRQTMFDLYRVPTLPLANCDKERCRCGYSGLKNRRRRDVLPAGMQTDRRAGAIIAWPGNRQPESAMPVSTTRRQVGEPLGEGLHP